MANQIITGFDPRSGSQNRNVKVTFTKNFGRSQRGEVITGTTGSATANCNFIQLGAKEFVEFERSTYTMNATATSVTITGRSNASVLSFSFTQQAEDEEKGDDYILVMVPFLNNPSAFTVTPSGSASISCTTGVAITGDPGETGQYNFSITLTLKNGYVATYSKEMVFLYVNGADTASAVCSIKRSTSEYITINGGNDIYVNADDTTTTVLVESNGAWTLSSENITD